MTASHPALDAVVAHVDSLREQHIALSHAVHDDAEVAFEEHTSSARVAAACADAGFDVMHGTAGMETAVVASYGSGPLQIGICAEYDALPGIGHACGHNIIASSAVATALALASVADEVGLTVRLLGTPAEEAGGGKILMLDAGSFDGLHASMMVHPAPYELDGMGCLAVTHVNVEYAGVSSHASAFPELGRNAADALTVAQVGIGLLRQHLDQSHRVHGIVTDGGDAPNIVPEHAGGTWYVRANTLAELAELYPRVKACFEAGAIATGTTLRIPEPPPSYSEFKHDQDLLLAYRRHAESLGRVFPDLGASADKLRGSTDMANVSLELPSIHPMLGLDTEFSNHQPGFTAACITASADDAVRAGAIAMARTAVEAATTPALRDRLLAKPYSSAGYEIPRLF
ncbi:MAG: amidohydrolase [Myxococcota bacterium]